MKTQQLTHEVLDSRYSFNLEWLGVATKQYAVRFCDEFITSAATYKEAYIKACLYEAKRLEITL